MFDWLAVHFVWIVWGLVALWAIVNLVTCYCLCRVSGEADDRAERLNKRVIDEQEWRNRQAGGSG